MNHQLDPETVRKLSAQYAFAKEWQLLDSHAKVEIRPTVQEAINYVRNLAGTLGEGKRVQAFVTGSLHLVGGALGIIEGKDGLYDG